MERFISTEHLSVEIQLNPFFYTHFIIQNDFFEINYKQ